MAEGTRRTGKRVAEAARGRRLSPAFKRVLAYVEAASPLLAELLQAEAAPTRKAARPRVPAVVVRTDRLVQRVTYAGPFTVEGEEFPYLAFHERSEGLNGQVRHFTRGFKVQDAEEFARVRREFAAGEQVEIETLIEWESSSTGRASRLLRVSKIGGDEPT